MGVIPEIVLPMDGRAIMTMFWSMFAMSAPSVVLDNAIHLYSTVSCHFSNSYQPQKLYTIDNVPRENALIKDAICKNLVST